ncbi:MAG: hypothetical protein ABH808_00750, partial [Candidatus Kuenenbacteria bacterium]
MPEELTPELIAQSQAEIEDIRKQTKAIKEQNIEIKEQIENTTGGDQEKEIPKERDIDRINIIDKDSFFEFLEKDFSSDDMKYILANASVENFAKQLPFSANIFPGLFEKNITEETFRSWLKEWAEFKGLKKEGPEPEPILSEPQIPAQEMGVSFASFEEARKKFIIAEAELEHRKKVIIIESQFFYGEKIDKKIAKINYNRTFKEYREAREIYAKNIEQNLNEKETLADERIKSLFKEKKNVVYKAWKKLGDLNLGEIPMISNWIEKMEPKGRWGKIGKGMLKFGAKFISARTVLSFSLLGVGFWGGMGVPAGIAALAGRRALGGLGTGFGTYGILKGMQESIATTKWNFTLKFWESRSALTDKEIDNLTEEDVEKKMAYLEIHAPLNGKKVSENVTYKKLQEKYKILLEERKEGQKLIEEKADNLENLLKTMSKESDEKLEKIKQRSKTNEGIIKASSVVIGTIVGSGVIYHAFSGKWGWEQIVAINEAEKGLKNLGFTDNEQVKKILETNPDLIKHPETFQNLEGSFKKLGIPDDASQEKIISSHPEFLKNPKELGTLNENLDTLDVANKAEFVLNMAKGDITTKELADVESVANSIITIKESNSGLAEYLRQSIIENKNISDEEVGNLKVISDIPSEQLQELTDAQKTEIIEEIEKGTLNPDKLNSIIEPEKEKIENVLENLKNK